MNDDFSKDTEGVSSEPLNQRDIESGVGKQEYYRSGDDWKKVEKESAKESTLPGDTLFFSAEDLKDDLNVDLQSSDSNYMEGKRLEKKRQKEEKKAEKNRKKQKSRENGCLFKMVWFVMIVLVSIMLARVILVGVNDMLAIEREETMVTIEIPKDSNLKEVTNILKDANVIEDTGFFKLYAVLTKSSKNFSHGTFDIKTNMDYEAIINYIQTQSNRTDIIEVTIPEGKNVMEYAKLLEEKGICNAQEFMDVCKSDVFDADYPFLASDSDGDKRYYKLEGYLFPDTYEFYKDENPEDTVGRLLSNYRKKVTIKEKTEGYEKKVSVEERAADKNISMEDLITLASIIQAEAASTEDMYLVSSVLHNRLDTIDEGGVNQHGEYGMGLLGMDCTVWYPYRSKEQVPKDIVGAFESAYNTYQIEGFPPGPICNPGLEAINAALSPESTNYYYFCHSADGEAYYAKTRPEHERNLEKAGLK